MLETSTAGSLPKPFWLATPKMLWAPWAQEGDALAAAKRDASAGKLYALAAGAALVREEIT